ncbi:hypothetical protein [Pseudonocardia spinosispora]|nr:hypothetical protein [Pseudonocardia spinosispora]
MAGADRASAVVAPRSRPLPLGVPPELVSVTTALWVRESVPEVRPGQWWG